MLPNFHQERVVNLYRSLLKEAHKLPDGYLSQFFHARIRRTFRKNSKLTNPCLIERDIKTGQRELRRLQAANAGQKDALNTTIEMAFGQRGAFRRQLLAPFITEAHALQKEQVPIISGVEKSRPPAYPPALKTLLTSDISRQTPPLSPAALVKPPKLPDRADPSSDAAQNLGRLSLRREVNIRKRFFNQEVRTLYPPLVVQETASQNLSSAPGKCSAFRGIGRRLVKAMGKADIFAHLVGMSSVGSNPVPLTRRERRKLAIPQDELVNGSLPGLDRGALPLPTLSYAPPAPLNSILGTRSRRFLRRRFAESLGKVPVLHQDVGGSGEIGYRLSLSPWSLSHRARPPSIYTHASQPDVQWIRRATEQSLENSPKWASSAKRVKPPSSQRPNGLG